VSSELQSIGSEHYSEQQSSVNLMNRAICSQKSCKEWGCIEISGQLSGIVVISCYTIILPLPIYFWTLWQAVRCNALRKVNSSKYLAANRAKRSTSHLLLEYRNKLEQAGFSRCPIRQPYPTRCSASQVISQAKSPTSIATGFTKSYRPKWEYVQTAIRHQYIDQWF